MGDNLSARRQKVHKTLIDIARVSRRLQTGLARENANLHGVGARTRLEKIVVASKSILTISLGNTSDTSLDPRLGDWLCSKEPDMCLHILSDMERLIVNDFGGGSRGTLWGKVSSAVHSMYSEGRINEAIKLFNDRQGFFHFLLSPEVWNYETGNRPQQGTAAPGIVPTRKVANEGSREEKNNGTVDAENFDSVLQWLHGFNCNEKHEDIVSLRQPDTCRWLPKTDRYNIWRNSDDSFLWLQGKAGAGKTVLVASVIEEIRESLQDGECVVFFYCDFRDERATSAAAVMRSILSQLLSKLRNGTGRDLIQLINDMMNGKNGGTLVLKHARSMTPFVSRAARQFNRQPFVVVDALDECQDVENLLHALRELTNDGVRLFVTGRPLQIIRDKFHDLPSISMDRMAKEVSADIKLHVTSEIDGNQRLRMLEDKVKSEILITLLDKADGMFRWAQCQIDTLKKCATARDIRLALYSLPSGLDETYERILRAIDPHSSDGKVALRALVWLVTALRPLHLAEILEALSIDLQNRRLDREIAPVHGYALLDVLGSLVVYDEECDVINLSHFSVKEYLIGTSSLMNLPMHHVDMQIAHAQVALLCMCYVAAVIKYRALSETETSLEVSSNQRTDIILSKFHPLLHYAFCHGFRHLQFLESGNRAVIGDMIALRSDIERHPVEWRSMCKLTTLCPPYPSGLPLSAQHDFVICVIISLLPESFLRAFLRQAPFKAFNGTSPLIYATYFHKIEHARTLLSCGVSCVNSTGLDVERPRQVLPLEVAFHYQHHSLFDLYLLDWRATVPSLLFSSIFYESYLGYNPRDATMLLQCDEFAEWVADGNRGQSLLRALHKDRHLVIRSALEKEALTVLRRLAQVGCDFSGPDSLGLVLDVTLLVIFQRSPSPGDWEVRCKDQLERLGLSVGSDLLKSVWSHQGVSSPEHKHDSEALRQLILQHSLHGPLIRCCWVTPSEKV